MSKDRGVGDLWKLAYGEHRKTTASWGEMWSKKEERLLETRWWQALNSAWRNLNALSRAMGNHT